MQKDREVTGSTEHKPSLRRGGGEERAERVVSSRRRYSKWNTMRKNKIRKRDKPLFIQTCRRSPVSLQECPNLIIRGEPSFEIPQGIKRRFFTCVACAIHVRSTIHVPQGLFTTALPSIHVRVGGDVLGAPFPQFMPQAIHDRKVNSCASGAIR